MLDPSVPEYLTLQARCRAAIEQVARAAREAGTSPFPDLDCETDDDCALSSVPWDIMGADECTWDCCGRTVTNRDAAE